MGSSGIEERKEKNSHFEAETSKAKKHVGKRQREKIYSASMGIRLAFGKQSNKVEASI